MAKKNSFYKRRKTFMFSLKDIDMNIKHKVDPNSIQSLLQFVLPEGVLNYYDLVNVEMKENCNDDVLFPHRMDIYLDEKDLRTEEQKEKSIQHGFSKYNDVTDFTIRNRKVVLHFRFRRFLLRNGGNLNIENPYKLKAEGTKLTPSFGAFLKGNG